MQNYNSPRHSFSSAETFTSSAGKKAFTSEWMSYSKFPSFSLTKIIVSGCISKINIHRKTLLISREAPADISNAFQVYTDSLQEGIVFPLISDIGSPLMPRQNPHIIRQNQEFFPDAADQL